MRPKAKVLPLARVPLEDMAPMMPVLLKAWYQTP